MPNAACLVSGGSGLPVGRAAARQRRPAMGGRGL